MKTLIKASSAFFISKLYGVLQIIIIYTQLEAQKLPSLILILSAVSLTCEVTSTNTLKTIPELIAKSHLYKKNIVSQTILFCSLICILIYIPISTYTLRSVNNEIPVNIIIYCGFLHF